jgi:hypothetical protein
MARILLNVLIRNDEAQVNYNDLPAPWPCRCDHDSGPE